MCVSLADKLLLAGTSAKGGYRSRVGSHRLSVARWETSFGEGMEDNVNCQKLSGSPASAKRKSSLWMGEYLSRVWDVSAGTMGR